MRILIVSDAWFPQVNGVVRALAATRTGLQALGHQVEVLGPHLFKTLPCPTYPEIRLAMTHVGRVGRQIERFEPDAVHVATEGPIGWAARSWLGKSGVAFTTSFHTMFPVYLNMRFGLPERWSFSVLRRFHGAASATMVSTPTLELTLRAQGFTNLVRWVRGVDTAHFRPVAPVALPGERPLQMYVGRVAVEKDIEAFLRLNTPGTKYVVGEGPQREALARRYPDVRFVGNKHGDDLVAHYAAADVFVFPSRSETLGLVMLEALACGVPVAALPVQGPVDIVGDSGVGVLANDLGKAAREAVGIDPHKCRARALEHSWERSVRQFVANLAPIRSLHQRAQTA